MTEAVYVKGFCSIIENGGKIMSVFKNVTIATGAVNETDSLIETVLTILRVCDHKDIAEILICCAPHISEDCKKTVKELEKLKTDVPIKVFVQKRKKLGAIVDCIEIAQGTHCIFVDSDLALDLGCVTEMIEKAKEKSDRIVSASRWMKGCSFVGYGAVKKVLNFFAQQFLKILFRAKMTDFTNPCQIAPIELYRSVEWENEGFPIFIEMVLKPLRLGYEFIEVPTNCYGRTQGKSNNSFMQTALYFNTALHIRFMKKKDIVKKDSTIYKKMFG